MSTTMVNTNFSRRTRLTLRKSVKFWNAWRYWNSRIMWCVSHLLSNSHSMCSDNILISPKAHSLHLNSNLAFVGRLWIQMAMLSCVCIVMISSIMINVLSLEQNAVDVELFWRKISFHWRELHQRLTYPISIHFNPIKVIENLNNHNY